MAYQPTRVFGTPEARFRTAPRAVSDALSQGSMDRALIEAEAEQQEKRRRQFLQEQRGVQSSRLQELSALLASNADRTFSGDIPGIAESSQAAGMLETSGFRDALVGRKEDLNRDVAFQIAQQGLRDRDLEVETLGDIGKNFTDLGTSGLERAFSVADQAKADELARELGRLGVVAPPRGPSSFDRTLDRTGQMVGIASGISGIAAGK